ncbi:hypothetical protein AVEN_69717-1 [Araneus ventricosus]|uniref:Uncharacterized protein n=1 Tax=Araneus ventricosus TaxID=182803 RepID=A0A4Y2PUW1_ARAVE|nr:hypothetical protein AVEN_69717-1 [Araneus ventricosus]
MTSALPRLKSWIRLCVDHHLHKRLWGNGSFERAALNRERKAWMPDKEQNAQPYAEGRPSTSGLFACPPEKKEIQCTMPQNFRLPSPGISNLQQCYLNYSG